MNIFDHPRNSHSQNTDSKIARKNATILVVDDDHSMRASVEALLQLHNFTCLLADGGESALDILKGTTIELVLLDLNMPGVDGYQVMHEIHSHYPDTDVIIVSVALGLRNSLCKPVSKKCAVR